MGTGFYQGFSDVQKLFILYLTAISKKGLLTWGKNAALGIQRDGICGFAHAFPSFWNAVPIVFSCFILSYPSEYSLTVIS